MIAGPERSRRPPGRLGLDPRTVATWVARLRFEPRRSRPRGSVLDPFKPRITRLLDTHRIALSRSSSVCARRIPRRRDDPAGLRPPHPAYQAPGLSQAALRPGECAQIDWGSTEPLRWAIPVAGFRFFVMVLAFSRQMFVEFTVSQTMEHFLACHEHGFAALGVPVQRSWSTISNPPFCSAWPAPRRLFNPRYLDFARHHGFAIEACNVARGNEKGRVESGVWLRQKEFLHGLELDRSARSRAAQVWLDTIAMYAYHRETQQRPRRFVAQERPRLGTLNPNPMTLHALHSIASSQFRITWTPISIPSPPHTLTAD